MAGQYETKVLQVLPDPSRQRIKRVQFHEPEVQTINVSTESEMTTHDDDACGDPDDDDLISEADDEYDDDGGGPPSAEIWKERSHINAESELTSQVIKDDHKGRLDAWTKCQEPSVNNNGTQRKGPSEESCNKIQKFEPPPQQQQQPPLAPVNEGCGAKLYKQFGGIFLTLLASMLSSTNLVLVKTLTKNSNIGPPEATVFGYSGVFIPSIPMLIYSECQVRRSRRKVCQTHKKIENGRRLPAAAAPPEVKGRDSVFQSVWPLTVPTKRTNAIGLLVQSCLGGAMVMCRFFALKSITVGDTAVISIGAPVIVTILGHFLLGEKTGIVSILMALLALLGVAIISRPPILTGEEAFDTDTLIGTCFAFASMACAASMTIILRKIRGVHFTLQLMISGAVGMASGFVMALILNGGSFSLPSNGIEILILTVVASFGFGIISFMLMALKIEKAGVVSLVRTCDVLFGFLLQFIFFHVQPDIYSSIGGFIICFGVIATAGQKYLESLPPPIRGGRKRGDCRGKLLAFFCRNDATNKASHAYIESPPDRGFDRRDTGRIPPRPLRL